MPYNDLSEGLIEKTLPIYSYFIACIARRMLFGLIAYVMGGFIFSTFTVLLNILLTLFFMIYLIKHQVFLD